MEIDSGVHFDWQPLVTASTPELLEALAEAHATIADLSMKVAFLRQEEARAVVGAKEQRLDVEGLRDAWTEKKFLIRAILEHQEVPE